MISPRNTPSIYFSGFDGVRAIAAFSVIIHHIEQNKQLYGYANGWHWPIVYQMGRLGVALFFVLSGFLITYLLLTELDRTKTIDIPKFYVRRILRIWPLYFFIILLGFFVFPRVNLLSAFPEIISNDGSFWQRAVICLLFLPNVAFAFFGNMAFCSHTWSIGVEEQFYLIWPWLIRAKKTSKTLITIGLILAIITLVIAYFWQTAPTFRPFFIEFIVHFRITAMAIGALGAYWVYKNQINFQSVFFSPVVQWLVVIVMTALLAVDFRVKGLNYEFYGLFFCYFIVNIAANPRCIFKLDYPVFHVFGKISYGLYVYHPVVVVACIEIVRHYISPTDGIVAQLCIYAGSLGLTIGIAWLSYHYFEQRFLTLKSKFTVVASGR
jgi:peptidoglycan/LPS O-acetylase OafA/YrhL